MSLALLSLLTLFSLFVSSGATCRSVTLRMGDSFNTAEDWAFTPYKGIISSKTLTASDISELLTQSAVDFTHYDVSSSLLASFCEQLPTSDVTELYFQGNDMINDRLQYLTNILPDTKISKLSLINEMLYSHDAGRLGRAIEASLNLTHINLSGSLKSAGSGRVVLLPRLRDVKEVVLTRNKLQYNDIQPLVDELPESSILALDLSGNPISYIGAKELARVLYKTQLRELNLHDTYIGNMGAKYLSITLGHSQVTRLQLSHNFISDSGAIALSEAIPMSKLTTLNLNENAVNWAGSVNLKNALLNSTITHLELAMNEIADGSAGKYAQVILATELEYLNLEQNRFGMEGMEKLLLAKNTVENCAEQQ